MGGLLGGPKGMLAPPLKLLGGGGPGPPSSYAYVFALRPLLRMLISPETSCLSQFYECEQRNGVSNA